jgi:Rod binding domain-containing protein
MSNSLQPILTGVGSTEGAPAALLAARKGDASPAAVKAAKDFESVFLHQVLQEMSHTVVDSGLLESGTTEQTQGIFWMYLSQDLGQRGGLGLWKEFLRHLPAAEAGEAGAASPARQGS